MDPKEPVIVFDKLSEQKQNELLLNQLSNDKITKDNVIAILEKTKIDNNLYDVLSGISIGKFITTKLSSAQKEIVYNKFATFLKDSDSTSTSKNDKKINSKNSSEEPRKVSIDGVEYTRSVSQLFATTKDFKNYVEPTDYFKILLEDIGADPDTKYISGQEIRNIDSRKNLELNGEIIQAIVKEKYNNSWFEFLKTSGLVKFNPETGKILKSELTSSRTSDGDWCSDGLGDYGSIWLVAVNKDGLPLSISFGEDWVVLRWGYPESTVRVASQKTA